MPRYVLNFAGETVEIDDRGMLNEMGPMVTFSPS